MFTSNVFDEWEFCPSDFTSDGKYIRFKDKEVNATFSCPQCIPFATGEWILFNSSASSWFRLVTNQLVRIFIFFCKTKISGIFLT